MTAAPRPTTTAEARTVYEARSRRFEAERDACARRSRLIATARLLAFAGAAGGLAAGLWGLRVASAPALALGVAATALFAALVVLHGRVLDALERAETLVEINRQALLRLDRRWPDMRRVASLAAVVDDDVARDLDVAHLEPGRASLVRLLGTAASPRGRDTLARWLLDGAEPAEIARRQAAVEELAGAVELRQELELRGRRLGESPPDPAAFLAWAEGEPWLLGRPALLWTVRALAALAVITAALRVAGVAPTGWVVVAVVVNLAVAAAFGRRVLATFETVAGKQGAVKHYARLLRLVDAQRFECELLRRIEADLHPGGRPASTHMRQLERLGGLADTRLTPLFHVPLVALTLWDFHVLWGFERWQLHAGRSVRAWFRALGEVEALAALAALRHDHPGWCFPTIRDGEERRLRATGLGHPLLPPDRCVPNDIEVGPTGTFLLVTGSNMSGKSTLLRALGANVALAQAGGPVCAASLEMPRVALGTSFRVHDSIEEGVSLFMAELQRLARIVADAERRRASQEAPLLYLLDEILQGTNVYERQVAVRRVILHLVGAGAIGAVSTHDLTLAEAEGLRTAARPCHFTETYVADDDARPRMEFDYTLRAGVATTRNALELLALVGLGEE